ALTPWVCEWFTGCLCDAFDWFGREPEGATPVLMPHVRRLVTVDGEVIERIGIDFEPKAAEAPSCPFLQRSQPAVNCPKPEGFAAEEQELTAVPKKRELQQALRSLVEAVQKGMDLDIELSPRTRVRCELHVGGVMYKVTVDDNGAVHCLRQPLTNR